MEAANRHYQEPALWQNTRGCGVSNTSYARRESLLFSKILDRIFSRDALGSTQPAGPRRIWSRFEYDCQFLKKPFLRVVMISNFWRKGKTVISDKPIFVWRKRESERERGHAQETVTHYQVEFSFYLSLARALTLSVAEIFWIVIHF